MIIEVKISPSFIGRAGRFLSRLKFWQNLSELIRTYQKLDKKVTTGLQNGYNYLNLIYFGKILNIIKLAAIGCRRFPLCCLDSEGF